MKVFRSLLSKLIRMHEILLAKHRNQQLEAVNLRNLRLLDTARSNPIKPSKLEIVATQTNTKKEGENWLFAFHNNLFSEHGEDGMIKKIFEILPPKNKWVCEFGAHDPEIISNTSRLINQENWHAVLIEADDGYFAKLSNYYKDNPNVHCLHSKVSYEGDEKLDSLLTKTNVPTDLDFMIIDIDGNDYHVWEAIEKYQATMLMIEFNAAIPSDIEFIQPKNMEINQGTSIKAMVALAEQKGYKLIAATSWNLFFVKAQYFHLFFDSQPKLDDMYVHPAKHPIWTRAFQLYDGTIITAHWNEMLWHKIDLTEADCQVLPKSYRFFSRELAAQEFVIEKDGSKTPIANEITSIITRNQQLPNNVLAIYAKNSFSRYGEDGILEKLIQSIPMTNRFFVEVGAWDGLTCNRARALAVYHGWRGLVLENDTMIKSTLNHNYKSYPKINIHTGTFALTGKQSLDEIFKQEQVPEDLDVLLLTTFGMEYYLLESLQCFKPKIIMVQFNPTIPNDVKYIQAADFAVHHGCSLRALFELAHYKDYELVATTLETAFLVHRHHFFRIFESAGICYSDLDDIFAPIQMKVFQLYDGTIKIDGLNRMFWHGLRIDEEKMQVVPKALRRFHQYADSSNKRFFYRV